ncbi:MAG TPA: hypothetical protein VFY18_04970, partial [Candidatus Limnocylindrales bacterium]|nr:hypothetical protein [Candidatus Limnocylindrales bacterium]
MFTRLRSTVLAGSGGLILVLSLSGIVAAATILTAIAAPVADPIQPAALVDTTATFEDLDGNGVDDDCQTDVVANPDAAAAAEKAADLDGDGKISVSEAAQSGRTGGKNCNHGGYVSAVAHSGDACDDAEPAETTDAADEVGTLPDGETVVAVVTETTTETTTADTTCTEETTDATEAVETTTETSETTDTTVCETTVTTTT